MKVKEFRGLRVGMKVKHKIPFISINHCIFLIGVVSEKDGRVLATATVYLDKDEKWFFEESGTKVRTLFDLKVGQKVQNEEGVCYFVSEIIKEGDHCIRVVGVVSKEITPMNCHEWSLVLETKPETIKSPAPETE